MIVTKTVHHRDHVIGTGGRTSGEKAREEMIGGKKGDGRKRGEEMAEGEKGGDGMTEEKGGECHLREDREAMTGTEPVLTTTTKTIGDEGGQGRSPEKGRATGIAMERISGGDTNERAGEGEGVVPPSPKTQNRTRTRYLVRLFRSIILLC